METGKIERLFSFASFGGSIFAQFRLILVIVFIIFISGLEFVLLMRRSEPNSFVRHLVGFVRSRCLSIERRATSVLYSALRIQLAFGLFDCRHKLASEWLAHSTRTRSLVRSRRQRHSRSESQCSRNKLSLSICVNRRASHSPFNSF